MRVYIIWSAVQSQMLDRKLCDTRISEDGLNTAIYKALIDVDIVMATGVSYIPLHFADSENESVIPRRG